MPPRTARQTDNTTGNLTPMQLLVKYSKIVGAVAGIVVPLAAGYAYGQDYINDMIDTRIEPVVQTMNIGYQTMQVQSLDIRIDMNNRELKYLMDDPNKNAVKIRTLHDDIRWLQEQKIKLQNIKRRLQ